MTCLVEPTYWFWGADLFQVLDTGFFAAARYAKCYYLEATGQYAIIGRR